MSSISDELDWVLVVAPFRRDTDYIEALLREHGIEAKSGQNVDDLQSKLSSAPGVILVSHEALNAVVLKAIADHLAAQPNWSEVPILVLLERAAPLARIRTQLQSAWPGSRLLFYSRPVAPLELVSGIQSNLLVRLRQRQVRDSIEKEKELRQELNHRVKNILASVTSIFRMTQRGATGIDDLARDFTSRLQALSNVHTAVFQAGGEEVSLSVVVETTVSPYSSAGANRIKVSGPDILVSRDAGTTIALCLHELVTNAIKYGALSGSEGHVEIGWSISSGDDPDFSLTWLETGGPSVREPERKGYGTQYVSSALTSLFGAAPDIRFAPDGLKCVTGGPLSRISPKTPAVRT